MPTRKQQYFTKFATVLLCSLAVSVEGLSLVDRFLGFRPALLRRFTTTILYEQQQTNRFPSNEQRAEEFLDFMKEPMPTMVGDFAQDEAAVDDDVQSLVHTIVQAADGRKAEDIVALSVQHVSTLASVLVLVSGKSRPQNQAIAAAITKDVEAERQIRPGGNGVPEGTAESGWMVLDYGAVMVHIMTPKSRLFYNVEGAWKEKGGIEMDLSGILVPSSRMDESDEGTREPAPEDDPFWS